ncbi:MAG TPA: hypothetical protein VKA09_16280 [Nitrososphaeraceae archaeon]|nr:hypothetical protein [Nitrososphaeraceae archaeon]
MLFLDGIKGILSRDTCSRAINYDKRTLEMKLDAEAAGVNFSLADFKTEVQKIRDASEFTQLLDNYQYQMCRVCRSLGKDDPEWRKYNKIRVGSFHILTSLQATLIAFKSDPEGQKRRLHKVVGDLQDYLLLVAREVMPNIEGIESKSYVSKGDLSEIRPNTVSKALNIAGLNEHEVNTFLEAIKD